MMKMNYNSIKNLSYSVSLLIHAILLLIFFLVTFTITYPPKEYVELSFGTSGKPGSSGAIGTQVEKIEETSKAEKVNQTENNNLEVKEVKLPKAKNTEEENIIKAADKKKDKQQTEKNKSDDNANSDVTTAGQGNKAKGNGSFGYDIDWGGKGQRKIYSYNVPSYPEGVNKQVDIRLRFSIMPDGTVGTILPLIKADTRLENAAINSLRQWRFEPLDPSQKQVEQTAVIVFPYRLQ